MVETTHMQSEESNPPPVIYISTNHPLVYRTIEKILPSYCIKLFSGNRLDCKDNWMLIVDTYSVREWLAITAHCGFKQKRPILILADEIGTKEEELRLVYLGARGIIPITNLDRDLTLAVGSVMEGRLWLRRATLSEHVMRSDGLNVSKLSLREEQIVAFLVHGSSNRQIGNTLGISDRTVKFHVSNILRKFKVKSRRELLKSKGASNGKHWSS